MIELADMIGELRRQLATALADGADEAVRFELGPVEIEATVAVSREAGADAKVRGKATWFELGRDLLLARAVGPWPVTVAPPPRSGPV